MDFIVDLENFLSKKRMPLKHILLTVAFWFFVFFAVVLGMYEGNYCSVIATLAVGFICLSFSGEIKKLHARHHIAAYQKSVASSGLDSTMFAFFVFAKNRKCVFVNRVAQNLFPGLNIRTSDDLVFCFGKHPKVAEAVRNLQIAAENMKPSHADVPMKLNSETDSIWRIAVSPLQNHGELSAWTIADLTPSNAKVCSPETDSNFLLGILNNSAVAYFCLNEENEIIFRNRTFSDWIGSKTENALYTQFSAYIIKERSEELPDVGKTGKLVPSLPAKITLKTETGDGLEVIARPILRTSAGDRVYMLTRDLQQNSDIIQALGKTKLYFEHIFDDAPFGIAVTDGAEIISASNKTFQTVMGANQEENNPSFLDYVEDEEKETVREKLYQLLTTVHKSLPPFEIHFKGREGKTVMVYVTKIDETKRTKETDGLVMYFMDISERKELQQQFVQSQKMQAVGKLAGGIAHDFNNLLTAMIGYCDLLLEKYQPSDQAFNDVMQIKQNANRASNLVRQLLAFSRQQTLQPKISGTTDMIGELSALLKRLLGAKIELKVMHGRDVGFIKVDQIQFEQVIINLAVNARDAMENGGTLTIRTSSYSAKEPKFLRGETMPRGDYVLIEVIDTGCGIDEKYLGKIFDPFFSSKEKGHGTGLGLSTVYGIVNQTGGFISVDSKIGEGTKFNLYFPMVTATEKELAAIKEKSSENKIIDLTGTGTVLLVEDEDAVRMFSSRALRDKGYRVIESSNGESALEFIKKDGNTIDLVITDVVMPKMDGPNLVRRIKEYNPDIKVIFISGYTEDSFRDSLTNDPKVHFLPKPFSIKELAGKVKEIIG
ncbi:MAG: response regulator [Holosporaceae bacterium]|jgi:two-component system cell cycle sensor histidine kinase/response regulator CckA|nr:response regulator [Holosporaceae bacterium]